MTTVSDEARARGNQKRSIAMLAEKNHQWKGDKVGYNQLHAWVKRRLPKPQFCEKCFNGPAYDLANVTVKIRSRPNKQEVSLPTLSYVV